LIWLKQGRFQLRPDEYPPFFRGFSSGVKISDGNRRRVVQSPHVSCAAG
jgi:hypothetical protein